jgi:hypothetical protein
MDDFENADFTKNGWEILQGDWEIKDGWWEANSPATGQGCFALASDVETHDGLKLEVTERDMGGGWSNGYIIFAYVDENNLYYAGARIGRSNWSTEKSALAGGEQNFLQVADPRIKPNQVIIPRYQVSIEGDDVVIYAEDDKGKWEEKSRVTMPGGMPIGRVGLAAENAITDFDDFVMSGPQVTDGGKLAVKPSHKLATVWASLKTR